MFLKDDQEVTSAVIHLGRLEQELRCWETMGILKVEPLSKQGRKVPSRLKQPDRALRNSTHEGGVNEEEERARWDRKGVPYLGKTLGAVTGTVMCSSQSLRSGEMQTKT